MLVKSGLDLGVLHLGDFRDHIHELEDGSVDCIITDPPYGIGYVSFRRRVNLFKDGQATLINDGDLDSSLHLLEDMCRLCKPKLKPDAHIYIFTTWRVMPDVMSLVSNYFYVKNCLVWDKRIHGSGDLDRDYAPQHEFILYCWLDENSGRDLNLPRPTNVLPFMRLAGTQMRHPTQKPLPLIQFLIEKSVPPGGLVIDPFAGSGTTLIAAASMGRRYWGCEIDDYYYEVALSRLRYDVQCAIEFDWLSEDPVR
jgi:site-specific DNA-methyltransferase (adenine-specific)